MNTIREDKLQYMMETQHSELGSLPKPKNLHLALKSCSTTPGLSPKQGPRSTIYSPVTDLAFNLGELSTSYDNTPKRRLSLSSAGTPTPLRPTILEKQMSFDAGISMDSPSPIDSPFLDANTFFKNATIQRFQSMPLPFCGFDSSPNAFNTESKHANETSPVLRKCHSRVSSPSHLASPNLKSVSPCGKAFSPRGLFSPCGSKVSPPLDEDESSQDSGVCMDIKDKVFDSDFRFVEPTAPAPRRMRVLSDTTNSPLRPCSPHKASPLRSFSVPMASISFSKDEISPVKLRRSSLTTSPATDEGDDGFLDLLDDEEQDLSQVPAGLESLFTKPDLTKRTSPTKRSVRRGLILDDENSNHGNAENIEPRKHKKPFCMKGLFKSPSVPAVSKLLAEKSKSFDIRTRAHSFKREPCRDGDETPQLIKRRKSVISHPVNKVEAVPTPKSKLVRCHSASEAMIKSAMNRCDAQEDLTGDFSRPYCLPLISGKHQDLKSITADTLSAVIRGEYSHVIEKAVIVDCRYPYEYEGGHIEGAVNYYTKGNIIDEFLSGNKHELYQSTDSNKRVVLIFHCEFSSERGPNMSRFLRNKDRETNKDCYPALHYPEIYLLDQGYKNFFHTNKENCEPQTYLEMADKDYVEQYKLFRAKSKSWNGEKSGRSVRRTFKL